MKFFSVVMKGEPQMRLMVDFSTKKKSIKLLIGLKNSLAYRELTRDSLVQAIKGGIKNLSLHSNCTLQASYSIDDYAINF